MTWTRLEHSRIWTLAKARYDSDPRLKYHVWQHIQRLYYHAEFTFKLPYDDQLDRAILGHDVIYDEHPLKEERSANWLLENDPKSGEEARAHIMRTAGHKPGQDNRILLLDLADFLFKDITVINRTLLEEESMALYGISSEEFARQNADFLKKMASAYTKENLLHLPSDERRAFLLIAEGIRFSISLSENRL
jgi:hypothetical protein